MSKLRTSYMSGVQRHNRRRAGNLIGHSEQVTSNGTTKWINMQAGLDGME